MDASSVPVLFDVADGVVRIRFCRPSAVEQQMSLERAAFHESTLTADFKEGTAAFAGKRKPNFTGK